MAEKWLPTFRTITRDVPPSVFDKSLKPEENRARFSNANGLFDFT